MTIITTGIKSDRIISRREIRDFLKDKDVTNLYILAVDKMQKISQEDPSSWFQIAGIHGRPYIQYDNVDQGGIFGGYCTHSSILFPTWHRPYLALFEQSISKHIFEIARDYPNPADRKRYISAAERFRIPYWDWASGATLPDIIATREEITVHAPDGTRAIKNPLYSYKFNPVYSDFGDGLPDEKIWEAWTSTLRYPTRENDKGESQPSTMQAWLENNRFTLRNRTYNLLTQAKDYAAFSNDGPVGDQQKAAFRDNLESIHGQIHGLVGRNGHMGVTDYAAFDPTFWMHHANVDRIFAIWQALNPTVWFPPSTTTSTTALKTVEDSKTPLKPFRMSADKFWDSDGVRDTRTFRYTYPELARWSSFSQHEKAMRLCRHVNRLYGKTAPVSKVAPSVFGGLTTLPPTTTPTTTATMGQNDLTPAESETFEISDETLPETHWHMTPSTEDDKPHYHEWIAHITVEKYAISTSFFIHIFLGDFSKDPQEWGLDLNLVGTHFVFANNATYTGCERCRDALEKHMPVTGMIPLTGALFTRFKDSKDPHAKELEPDLVVPYLKKNLHWRIQRHNGEVIEPTKVPNLKISVGQSIVEVPASASEFPTWGKTHIQSTVTTGRVGGAS